MSFNSLSSLESTSNNLGVELPTKTFKGSEVFDFEGQTPKRKTLDDKASLVTAEFLNKTRVDIQNAEHAQVNDGTR